MVVKGKPKNPVIMELFIIVTVMVNSKTYTCAKIV